MNQRERQQKEIATIKERTLTIKLSDADVLKVCKKAGRSNTTVAEMVESYLQDLVGGTYTSGSDERDMANAYFERCHHEETSFFNYLLDMLSLHDYLENIDTANDIQDSIEIYENIKNPDADEKAELEALKEDLQMVQGYLQDYYKGYCTGFVCNQPPETMEQAHSNIVKWYEEYKKLKGETEE